jgi:hypothetical protein
MLVRVIRWWLPWLVTLGVSASIAHAANDALTTYTPPAMALSPKPTQHIVRIRSNTPAGEPIKLLCTTHKDFISVDEMVLAWADVGEVVASTCDQVLIE